MAVPYGPSYYKTSDKISNHPRKRNIGEQAAGSPRKGNEVTRNITVPLNIDFLREGEVGAEAHITNPWCDRGAGTLAYVFIFAYFEYMQTEATMSQTTTMTVRISGALSEFVALNVGESGAYENISEYVRDLIRRDKERTECEAFDRLKAELTRAFGVPEESYRPLTAAEVIARNRG